MSLHPSNNPRKSILQISVFWIVIFLSFIRESKIGVFVFLVIGLLFLLFWIFKRMGIKIHMKNAEENHRFQDRQKDGAKNEPEDFLSRELRLERSLSLDWRHEQEHYCPDCGKNLDPDFRYCPYCGRSLDREISTLS